VTLQKVYPFLKDEEFLSVVTILHSVWKKDEWEEANQIVLHKSSGTKKVAHIEICSKKSKRFKVPA